MYRIGICDDDEEFCWELEKHLMKYCKKIYLPIETQIFTTGTELFQHIEEKGRFDIIFLDIELNDTNGVVIGNILRKDISNETTQIVFVSSKNSYAMQLFQIRPMDFLIKPVTAENVKHVIDTYCRLFVQARVCFEYKSKKQIYRIDERSILYFQSVGQIIHIFTTNGEDSFYGKLSDVLEQLGSDSFCSVHKSFIVNLNYVSEYRVTELVMANGTLIPVSQSQKKQVKELILRNNIIHRGL